MSIKVLSPNDTEEKGFIHIDIIEKSGPFIALITTRLGGVSPTPFDSFNMSDSVGDDPSFVEKNRWRLANHLGVDVQRLIQLNQVHSAVIYEKTDPKNRGMLGDGQLVYRAGYFAVISVADCIPLFLVDPIRRVGGVIHAGWRGLHQSIISKAVAKMRQVYGTDPNDVIAVVGPSIGPCHYEVQRDVIEKFNPILNSELTFYEQKENRYFLNLWVIARDQLIKEGVYPGRIYVQHECTVCRPELYFSHRGSHGKTGRIWAVLGLKSTEKS
ncbi:MAG: hypothetical protein B6244_02455 [Candidatus Cloacimonetes bacterium 4572_55]|nr:MAG: hypothetical protein B6244_02455 [Candidatus Cloacimonetes bacterium 4572_55]